MARLYSNAIIGKMRWSFPATTKVLGIKARDNECGCDCGMVIFACNTKARSPWQDVASGDTNVQIFGSNSKDKIPRTNLDWSTDDTGGLKADKWPKARDRGGTSCMSQDEPYWERITGIRPSPTTELSSEERALTVGACTGDQAAYTAQMLCGDETQNEGPNGERGGKQAPYYWWVRVEL